MASASSSAAAQVIPQQKYDVFLSFRGPDTRLKFTSHLYAALKEKRIHAYIDDESLERGDEIGPALLEAIEQSKLSIIIFSKRYASSPWCLDELVHILKCMLKYGQLVLPIFYEVKPSDVRRQQGTYKDAFAVLEERYKVEMDKIKVWRKALTTAAGLSGYELQSTITNERELIEAIVENVLKKLNRKASYSPKGLVGMENHIKQLELLLSISAQDVTFRAVCIWGMGGCGKTTLADVVFHRNSSEFHACVFLANVREKSEKHGLNHLRNVFLRKLLNDESISIDSPSIGLNFVIDRLSRTKVLAVLDDVSDLSQLEILLGDQVQFGSGSRIIITTRNRRILNNMVHENHVYKMNVLPYHDALQLFQSIAFQDDSSVEGYSDLSDKVVNYAGCNPLALKVLGSSFFNCKSKKRVWEDELEKLKTSQNKEVHDVLRWSYEGLEENEKRIFLHIACYLKGENRYIAERILEMFELFPVSGIEILIDMSLISIDSFNRANRRIEMHDMLQEMGRAIEAGTKKLRKRIILWNNRDSYEVLRNESEASIAEATSLDMSKIPELQLSPTAFKNMHKLRFLKLYVSAEVHEECKRLKTGTVKAIQPSLLSCFPLNLMVKAIQRFLSKSRILSSLRLLDSYNDSNYDYELFQKYCKLSFPKGLGSLPPELRHLYWEGLPFKSLPSKFFPENLMEIHMPHSQVKQLWGNNQNLGSLKRLNLKNSEQLVEVPDLSVSPKIERIDLSFCTRLVEVPSYFQNLKNLTYLNLVGCSELKILGGIPCNIEVLVLYDTKIKQIPASTWSCEKLHKLDLRSCYELESLNASQLNGGDEELLSKSISSESCKLKRQPPSLRNLDLSRCKLVSEIPDSLICLPTLEDINLSGTMIESIPTSIKNVSGLRSLDVSHCSKLRSIPELPSQLQELVATSCTSLKSVASSSSALMRPHSRSALRIRYNLICGENFNFNGCWELDESSRNNIMADAQLRIMRMVSLVNVPHNLRVSYPGNEIPGWFEYKSEGCEINIKFPHHKNLDATESSQEYRIYFGFASAVVVDANIYLVACDYNFKSNDGQSYRGTLFRGNNSDRLHQYVPGHFGEDKVTVFLSGNMFWDKVCRPFNELTEASFRFTDQSMNEVKKCGVHMLHDDVIDPWRSYLNDDSSIDSWPLGPPKFIYNDHMLCVSAPGKYVQLHDVVDPIFAE